MGSFSKFEDEPFSLDLTTPSSVSMDTWIELYDVFNLISSSLVLCFKTIVNSCGTKRITYLTIKIFASLLA